MLPGRRNVAVVLVSSLLANCGLITWQGQILSIFLKKVVHADTVHIGLIEGLQGSIQLLSALVVGRAVDYVGPSERNRMIRLCVAFTLAVLSLCGFCLSVRVVWVWYICCCAWAPVQALQMSLTESIFADSVTSGARVRDYTNKRMCALLGMLAGPLVQLGILGFLTVDDEWTEGTLYFFMLFGIAMCAAASLLQLLLDQTNTLGAQSEALQAQEMASPMASVQVAAVGPEGQAKGVGGGGSQNEADAAERPAQIANQDQVGMRVRWSVLAYDIVRVLAGGLAVKWFGLYFAEVFEMSPSSFVLLTLATRVLMVVGVQVAGWLCKKGVSRTRVCFALLLLNSCGNFAVASGHSLGLCASGWMLREGALNAVMGLKQTILMDYTPKNRRGVWTSVGSLNSGVWSGSAMIGGWLIHSFGYRANFVVMSWGFVLAGAVWTCVMKHCPK